MKTPKNTNPDQNQTPQPENEAPRQALRTLFAKDLEQVRGGIMKTKHDTAKNAVGNQ